MDNVTAQFPPTPVHPPASSYVDAYIPPSSSPSSSTPPPAPPVTSVDEPAIAAPEPTPALPEYKPMNDLPATSSNSAPTTFEPTTYAPTPTPVSTPAMPVTPPSRGAQSEELEDQNIFVMLGVTDGTPEQRESFLDELQQVIWEDFLEYDVKLLVTKTEQEELSKILSQENSNELEKQEKAVVYLEKLIPDLEEIMLEKALELKEEMIRERVKGMREFYKDKPDQLKQLDKADELMQVGKWYSAATLLNSIR